VVAFQDHALVGGAGVTHANLDEESIKLRFRQWVRAFEFQRILRSEHGEEIIERMRDAVHRHLALFHALQKRGLSARRHAVDFVGEQELREDRSAMKGKFAGLEREDAGAENVGGHHVRRALNAAKIEGEKTGERFDGHRFGDPGNTFDQRMAATEKGEQGLINQFGLAGDDFAQLGFAFFEDQEDGANCAVGIDNIAHALSW